MLWIPVFRYVDDYFSLEKEATARHAMQCFVRLVRATLGPDALAERKTECKRPLEVLGIEVEVEQDGVTLEVTATKRKEWGDRLREAKHSGILTAGEASKHAGRLGFAAQKCFHKIGRAMLRPFFAQQYAPLRGYRMSPSLKKAVDWWLEVLADRVTQKVPTRRRTKMVQLFTDARSKPPRLAAVLVTEEGIWYTDLEPSQELWDTLRDRRDKQIMAWEMLAIALGTSTFAEQLKGKLVRVWCDNVGAEKALSAGAAKATDHNMQIHALWLQAARNGHGLWIERVPTDDNVADLPSREEYELLERIGAQWTKPVMDCAFEDPSKWSMVGKSLARHGNLVISYSCHC